MTRYREDRWSDARAERSYRDNRARQVRETERECRAAGRFDSADRYRQIADAYEQNPVDGPAVFACQYPHWT